MKAMLLGRTTLIWFILVAATVLSWQLGHGVGFDDLRQAGVAILIVAIVKVRLVILEFMEIRQAPQFMRIVAEAWCVIICVVLVTLFLAAPPAVP